MSYFQEHWKEAKIKPVDVGLEEAFWRIGWMYLTELEGVATQMLVEGYDSPALTKLASGLADSYTAGSTFDQAMRELGREPASEQEAALRVGKHIAAEIVSGAMSPDDGVKLLAKMHWTLGYVSWLTAFYVLEEELDGCCGISTEECRKLIVEEARKLLESQEPPVTQH